MPANQFDYFNFSVATTPLVTTAETVVATTRAISSSFPGVTFFIAFGMEYTAGTGTTSYILRVRRSALTGTAVYTSGNLTVAAAQFVIPSFATTDAIAGEVASLPYVVTVQQNAATGNGSVTNAWTAVTVGE